MSDSILVPLEIRQWWEVYLKGHHTRYLDVLSFLDEKDKQGQILEIGSIPGQLTVLLKTLGYNVRGVDIDPKRLEKLWRRYKILVDKVDIEREDLPYPSDSFDIILFTEILEHMRINPLQALREAYRTLKPTGRLILSTPNITPISRVRFLFNKSYQGDPVWEFQKLEWLGHMGHVRLYSYQEVCQFLKHVGFHRTWITFKGRYINNWKIRLLMLIWRNKQIFRPDLYVIATR